MTRAPGHGGELRRRLPDLAVAAEHQHGRARLHAAGLWRPVQAVTKGTPTAPADRRTIGGRSVLALNGVAPAVIFGDCIRVQIPASSSFASIWLKSKVEKYADNPTSGCF
jgi:hypothetical protein